MHRSSEYVCIPDASVVPGWRKSSYSGGESGDCLEVSEARLAPAWRKSSYSGGDSDACLEVNDAHPGTRIPVRDSKNPTGPAIPFTSTAWTAFLASLHSGDLT
ncbi:DUF397 domain-containing protein [Streptomyces sp. KLOTTS4A1]|uniref:DUF397 domain-containing protein n=1 Tax=Streptomyces sp. KLOTTS4A1 TaxID=3390996 RepID=UPI0039F63F1F